MNGWFFQMVGDLVLAKYVNSNLPMVFTQGAVLVDTPEDEILGWVIDNGQWGAGDWVVFQRSGRVLRFGKEARA